MIVARLTPNRLAPLLSLTLCLTLLPPGVTAQRPRRGAGNSPGAAAPANTPVRIAVLPFRNSLARQTAGGEDASVLGDGIADSLTNALKSVPGLSVIDSEVVLRAADKFGDAEVTVKDEDAARVADSLSAQILVAGSFQLSGSHLHVDARLLTVDPAARVPPRRMTADARYPDDYTGLLNKLLALILTNLKLPLSRLSAAGNPAGTRSPEAYRWYVQGVRRMRAGDAAALTQAIAFFDKAIALDANYSQALAAKSEAETQLHEINKGRGERDDALGRAALADARAAVAAAPGSGRAYRAQARAQSAAGDYASAAQSAGKATEAWPGDAESFLELARALGNGRFARSRETDRLLANRPDLALLLPELPKVLVVNDSDYSLTLNFNPAQGPPYPAVGVGPRSSRIVPLFPGDYRIAVRSQAGGAEEQYTFEAGRDYQLNYSASSFPSGTFTFVNTGGYPLQIRVSGPFSTSLVLSPRATRSVPVPPGSYSITARVQSAVTTDTYEIDAGQEEEITYTYSVGRGAMFSPSKLTILNSGNSSLSVTIGGPRRLSAQVPPGGRSFTLPAGSYTVRVTCGRTEVEEVELSPDEETTLEYSCIRTYR